MAPIPKGATVAVTGAAGFIGSHIVVVLLQKGYRVKACVRNVDDPVRCDFLKAMAAYKTGRLTLHNGDVDVKGILDDVLPGCHGFCHVSHVSDYGNEEYVQGVAANLISSINKSGTVCRVIFTSSTAGVRGPEFNPRSPDFGQPFVMFEDRYHDEEDPGRVATRKTSSAYSVTKAKSEKIFAEAAAASRGRWDSMTLNPSDNVGPILSPHQKKMGPWQHNIELLLRGIYPSVYPGSVVYRPWTPVDVRDCAAGHVGLLESLSVKNGERYIAWKAEHWKLRDISNLIAEVLPEIGYTPPEPTDGDSLKPEAHAKDGIDSRQYFEKIWLRATLRNDRIKAATGITFRPFEESLRDCVESLIAVGGVKVKEPTPKAKL